MTAELQHLLEKIQKDGIDKAEKTASEIIEKARSKAAELVEQAGKQAAGLLTKAEKDAEAFSDKARKSIEQAARNTIISAKSGIQKAVESVISSETSKAMDDSIMQEILIKVVDAYCTGSSAAQVLVNEKDVGKFESFILQKLSDKAREGLQVGMDNSVTKGFRLVLKNKKLEHDLTSEAISEALAGALRPHIAEILNKA